MSRTRTVSAAIAAVLFASPLVAQRVVDTPSAPIAAPSVAIAAPTPAITPSLASTQAAAPVGVRVIAPTAPLAPAPTPQVGRNPAMMIVGGAMLLVGAVIGGDAGTLVMIGGGGIGLLGLWNYLR